MGSFAVGTFDNTMNDRLKAVDVFFDSVGLSYTNPPDMTRQLWNKLLLNDGVNQTTAVFETNYGGIQVPGKARETMIGAMKEVVAVAKAHHIDLRDDDITAWLPSWILLIRKACRRCGRIHLLGAEQRLNFFPVPLLPMVGRPVLLRR
jgi:ketopantoate reductase